MDLFERIKDVNRAYCEQRGIPSPDGKTASEHAHLLLREAEEDLAMFAAAEG